MKTKTAIKNLVSLFGNQTKTAEALRVKQPTVNGWLSGKHGMSAVVAIRAEKLTEGEFQAATLCPDLADLPPAA